MIKEKLFLKVFSVSQYIDYQALPNEEKYYWNEKSTRLGCQDHEVSYVNKSGIYAEFARVGAIGLGIVRNDEVRFKFFKGDTEEELLISFIELIENKFQDRKYQLCGYNIKEFDVPFLCRRLLVNSVNIPDFITVKSQKPWEYPHLELLNFWKFGDHKNFIPMGLMCKQVGVDYRTFSNNSALREAYFSGENDLIFDYLENEVNGIIGLFKRFF